MKNLFNDLDYYTGTNCAASFTDSEACTFIKSDCLTKNDFNLDLVARHDHLGSFRKMNFTGNVRCADVELRFVTLEEWSMASTFLFGKDVRSQPSNSV